ncbi:MAG: hypothetical protein JNL05_03090 [Flavobacteriales bacterium]|nr:hypothetical protein [Flavobacteriales bacterium]
MLQVPSLPTPPASCLNALDKLQAEVDACSDFASRVVEAKKLFKSNNRRGNATFDEVKSTLRSHAQGAQRCAYCEDSVGDEVEHMRPKDHFPEECFKWDNYVFACGPCNSPKGNRFAVFEQGTDELIRYGDPKWPKGSPPPPGDDVLLNVRHDDPLAFAMLDLRTFRFVAMGDIDQRSIERYRYTFIEVLNLSRELLLSARRTAYHDYKALLGDYIALRDGGAPHEEVVRTVEAIKRKGHRTVWEEMKRYHRFEWLRKVDGFAAERFDRAPECFSW